MKKKIFKHYKKGSKRGGQRYSIGRKKVVRAMPRAFVTIEDREPKDLILVNDDEAEETAKELGSQCDDRFNFTEIPGVQGRNPNTIINLGKAMSKLMKTGKDVQVPFSTGKPMVIKPIKPKAYLEDDGTLDTVIGVTGKKGNKTFRFNPEGRRNISRLKKEAIEAYNEEEY
jgi:hypothetical protein